jgi:hypothetical protein
MAYSVKKAGRQFLVTADTSSDLSGKAGNFSLIVKNNSDGSTTGNTIGAFSEVAESAGTYQVPVTVPVVGDYTIIISNDTDGLQSLTAPVVVTAASIDDVKGVVDSLTVTLDEVQTQVDTLDGAAIDAIAGSITSVQEAVDAVQDMIINKTSTITFTGADESASLAADEIVTGSTSEAYGTVVSAVFSGGDTIVELVHVVGSFVNGEELTGGTANTTNGIDAVVEGNTTVDSVLEFVSQINEALADTGTGLSALKGFTDDIENMLLGTEYLNDGSTPNPFYNANNPGVSSSAQMDAALVTLQSDIVTARTSVESKLDVLIGASGDGVAAATLFGKLAASKAIVDANKASLENAGYGLSALQVLLDSTNSNVTNMAALFADGGSIEVRYDQIDSALAALSANVDSYQAILIGRFDSVDASLTSIEGKVDNISAGANSVRIYA